MSFVVGIGNIIGEHDKVIVAAFTIILALSTILLWTATYQLFGVTRDTLAHSEQTSKKELRSYLGTEVHGVRRYRGD